MDIPPAVGIIASIYQWLRANAAEELDGTVRAKATPNKKLHSQLHEANFHEFLEGAEEYPEPVEDLDLEVNVAKQSLQERFGVVIPKAQCASLSKDTKDLWNKIEPAEKKKIAEGIKR